MSGLHQSWLSNFKTYQPSRSTVTALTLAIMLGLAAVSKPRRRTLANLQDIPVPPRWSRKDGTFSSFTPVSHARSDHKSGLSARDDPSAHPQPAYLPRR